MDKSNVYFTNMELKRGENLLTKLERLVRTAGMDTIDFQDRFVAIKIHFGEPGNLAYLRSNYAKKIADIVKTFGGRPFLTDCNTLYVGRRKNALDHLDAAYENGYSPFQTGCHVIIADGIKGKDETLIPIHQEYVKEAKIGKAIAESDIFISMNHFKGHEGSGFGGAIKNIGMGCGSRAGKMEMHSSGKPYVVEDLCKYCKECFKNCAHDAIRSVNKKAIIVEEKCVGCGRCIGSCNFDAIRVKWNEGSTILNRKMAEYALAVLKDKPHFHINFVIDVSPTCDCYSSNQPPIIQNVGFFASFDPVAIDQASYDFANKMPLLYSIEHKDDCHFKSLHHNTDSLAQLTHGEKIGLGLRLYDLITI